MKAVTALLLVLVLIATAAIAVESQRALDPLAQFRAPDGSLHIPGSAWTPELQQLLFGGNELQPEYNLTFLIPERSPYPTMRLDVVHVEVPNLNVFVHPKQIPRPSTGDLSHLIQNWFPPIDWHSVADQIAGSIRQGLNWLLSQFTWNARADTVSVDTTAVATSGFVNTCTTTQTAKPADNAVLVLLSERGDTAYATVTYGSVSLTLITGTAVNNGANARTEMWFFQGAIPTGSQVMTATLSGGTTQRQVCATILLAGVSTTAPTAGGTTATGATTNPSIAISPAAGELAFSVLATYSAGGTAPTAVTGTGATATSLYGIAPTQCAGAAGYDYVCAAGADLPNPGTAITWTQAAATWAISAVRVAPAPNCSAGGGNCYRIGIGGTWGTVGYWSNTSGGGSCGCTPAINDNAIFNTTPTGTTTLAAATTIASINMTGYTGTLDTTASSWGLTVNGNLTVQGVLNTEASTIRVTGNVNVSSATAYIVNTGGSWTVTTGAWTNASTSASWSFAAPITFTGTSNETETFGIASDYSGSQEFKGAVTFDSTATGSTSITYTIAGNALVCGGLLTIQQTGSSSGTTTLTDATNNLTFTSGGLRVANKAILTMGTGTTTINGNVTMTGGTSGTITMSSGSFTVSGTWNTSGAGSIFTKSTSTITMSGSTQNVSILNASNGFYNFYVSGTIAMSTAIDVSNALQTSGSGTLTTGGYNITGGAAVSLAGTGGITSSTSAFTVGAITIGSGTLWSITTGTITAGGAVSVTGTLTDTAGNTGYFTFGSNSLTVNNGGIVNGNQATVTVTNVTMTGGSSGTIGLTSGGWTVAGTWNTSGTGSVFTKGTSTITMSGPTQNVSILNASNGFYNLTVSGTITQSSAIDVSNTLSITGTLTTSNNNITGGSSLTVSATGTLTAGSSSITVTSMDTSAAGATFTVGTSTVIISASGGSSNIPQTLYNLTVNTGITTTFSSNITWSSTLTMTSAAVTFIGNLTASGTGASISFGGSSLTISGNWNTSSATTFVSTGSSVNFTGTANTITLAASQSFATLTISGSYTQSSAIAAGATTVSGSLSTSGSNYALSVGDLTITGTLTANGSAIGVSGNWTSNAGTFTAGTSTVTLSGAGKTVNTVSSFATLTVSGTYTQSSDLEASSMTVTGTLTKTSHNIIFNTLTVASGSIVDGSVTVTHFAVTNSEGTAYTTVSTFTTWTADSQYAWTHTSSSGTTTLTFTISGLSTSVVFNVYKNGVWFTDGNVSAGSLSFTMLGSDPSIVVNLSGCSGTNRYWVLGSGNWNATGHWASTSGGVEGCTIPSSSIAVYVDANSGSGTITVNVNAALASLNTTASTIGTIALGTYDFVVTGNVVHANGIITVGASTANGLMIGGNLALSGTASIDGSGASSVVSVAGNVTIGASAYLKMGSGTWTFSGAWSNSSTSPSWVAGTGTVLFNSASSQPMSFAALAGSIAEFNNVTFQSTASAGTVTFTMSTNRLVWGAALTVQDTAGSTTALATANLALTGGSLTVGNAGILTANASTASVVNVSMTGGTSGTITLTSGSWSVSGSWNTSGAGSTFTKGTSTVTMSGTTQTVSTLNTSNGFYNLTIAGTITMSTAIDVSNTFSITGSGESLTTSGLTLSGGANLVMSSSGTFNASTSTVTFTSVTMTDGTAATISLTSGSWTVSGSWNTSGATSIFTQGTSTITMSGTIQTVKLLAGQSFATLTITGTITESSAITASTLNINSGSLTKGTNALTVNGNLTLGGGALLSTSGTVTVTGSVNISSTSYIAFGSENWTVSGSWTNSSTSASWSVGTATVTFNASSSQTMTFAALPGDTPEFYNVTFNSGASTGTFTMATNALVWSGTLTVQGGGGTTTLATSDLGLVGGALSVGDAGLLNANASSVTVSSVTMTGGTSGTLTLTTGAWSVSGSWDTSGAGSTLIAGTSTVSFTGVSTAINLAPGQMFYNLSISGTVSIASTVTASAALMVNNGAVLTKTGQSIAFNSLTETGSGSITDGAVAVVNLTVANSDPTNITTISVFSIWNVEAEYNWTDSSTVGTSIITFTIGGNTSGYRFNVTKDAGVFMNGIVDASGQATFTMLGSDPVVDVLVLSPCGSDRYWIDGSGSWSQTFHWAPSSGGLGGCAVPTPSNPVFFDANSGGGTVTVGQNAGMASLNTTGWAGTIAIGTFDFAVSGDIVHATGIITIGASSNSGLTAGGNLTVLGTAVLDGSGAASVVSIAGNVLISSATAYFRMGSGTWTFGGSWSNNSTSANWAAGTGTVLFDASSSQTMTFANLTADEFYNVAFGASATSGTVTFTMATNGLRWSNLLTIQDTAGSTIVLAPAGLPLTGGSLTVGNSGALIANRSSVSVVDVTMNSGTSGAITLTTGTWTVRGNWDTSGAGSTFTKGTSTVIMAGATKTVKILNAGNGFYNLTISGTIAMTSAIEVTGTLSITGTLTTSGNTITGGANLVVSGGGTLIGTTSSISVAGVTMNDASANTISLTSGSISASGSWDTSGASSTFAAGTSTVTLSAASGTISLGASQAFAILIISGSIAQASQLTAGSLTISEGGLTKGTYTLTVNGNLTLTGGYLVSTSGTVAIGGDVDVSSNSSYIAFGSEAWTVFGSWTNNSTSAAWVAGSGTVTFDSSSAQTMTFAGANLRGNEFNAVVFNSGSSTVTFTMAARGLIASSITILGGSGTTTLSTSGSNLPLSAGALNVASRGVLTANGSTITVRSVDTSAGTFTPGASTVVVNASGGSIRIPQVISGLTVDPGVSTTFASNVAWSATLMLTGATVVFAGNLAAVGPATLLFDSSTVSIAGSWDTSSTVSGTPTSSSVTFTGSDQTITLGTGQQFATLTIAGTIALASNLVAATLTVNASSTLTKTNYSITFNSLTVNGTLADGSANVTNLIVTNSDGTAFVTIPAFTEWSSGSLYAWTHTSSETSQTITWTIEGNTAGYLYTVTKNGSSFKSGTVDGSGQVVFTMFGSDPDMRVTVAAPLVVMPPPAAWWQSPYLFAILPFGLIVVIAMFVQRQRWRPTKAFLVDERGQLIREFTLDPSCEVTYDQALQAGALNAVDRDVRVSKYHARAVRGDMLSLILLAIGPANVQEVEFARGILVNVQDRFENRVKQRAEDARTQEAALQASLQQFEKERADLQARSQAFSDMVNASITAQAKLEGESRAIRAKSEDLANRERLLEEGRKTVDDTAREMDTRRASLDQASAQMQEQRDRLDAALKDLETREARLSPMEQDLSRQESELTTKETDLKEREDTLTAAESKLTADLEDYHGKAQQLRQLQDTLTDEQKTLDDVKTRLSQDRDALAARATDVATRERELATAEEILDGKLADLEPHQQRLAQQESDLKGKEDSLAKRMSSLATQEARLTAQAEDQRAREDSLATQSLELATARQSLDERARALDDERIALEAKAATVQTQEAEVAKRTQELADLRANLGPREAALLEKEATLGTREKELADERVAFESKQNLVAAKALEVQQQMEALEGKHVALDQERMALQEDKGTFEMQSQDLENRRVGFDREVEQRKAELDAEKRTLAEAQLKLTKETEEFEALRTEKNQRIASREIELEAKEQTLLDKETSIRTQAEENAKHLSELAAREEALEIEATKLDKTKAEAETRKAEILAMTRDLDTRTSRFQAEEARKGEEMRTWQATLDSEQTLLKEQRETLEKEMQEVRESWAGRMLRVEQREEELKEREAKVQTDVDWVAQNESEIGKREKALAENLKIANDLKADTERLHKDLEQRALELESRERTLREEAANQSVELQRRTEALQSMETEFAGHKAQAERELATLTQTLKDREDELLSRSQGVDAKEASLVSREAALADLQEGLRKDQDRLNQDRSDLQLMEKQLEAAQLELTQGREQLDAETARLHAEDNAARQSLAAKEADLLSERERLERESTTLQDKLGTKAKEMAAREKDLAAREDELRVEEHELEAHVRELESRDRQIDAQLAEIAAKEQLIARGEGELKSQRIQFDETVQKFERESAGRKKEWEDLQTSFKSQEAQFVANTETRQAEIQHRMEDLEQREGTLNASLTQLQIERTQLEAQARNQTARQTEVDAATLRAEKRSAELKNMEDELLKARQSFESEKTNWSGRRSEELKQLEATRDAAAEQTQQAERFIEDSQRRAYMATEAEKSAKRQAEELVAAQAELDRRRANAEEAEKDLETQTAQLREASQKLAAKEVELASRARELDTLRQRLGEDEQKRLAGLDDLKNRKAVLDQEAEHVAATAAELDKRKAEDEARHATLEGELAELANREQILTTELQRADNLMEDLTHKEAGLVARDNSQTAREQELAKREEALTQRDADLAEGMHTLERLRKEQETQMAETEGNRHAASQARKEAEAVAADAEKMKAQAEAMQTEVSKNMRFLQKKALDVLDREEKIRMRETKSEEEDRMLEARAQILEQKERVLEVDREEVTAKLEKIKQENDKLKAQLAEVSKSGQASVDMEEWKRDIDNRVKIIQKKALDLLAREEKLQKKEEELKILAAQLDAAPQQ